jgi:hypothetical protein
MAVAEMQYACATPDGDAPFDPYMVVLPSGERMLQCCGPLVELHKGQFYFTHRTVREFQSQPPSALSPKAQKYDQIVSILAQMEEAHAKIAFYLGKLTSKRTRFGTANEQCSETAPFRSLRHRGQLQAR